MNAVVEGGNIGRSLDGRMPAQRDNATARPSDIAQEQLQQCAATDHLGSVRMLSPSHGVAESGCVIPAGIRQNSLSDFQEDRFRAAGYALHHLRGVAGEVALEDLQHCAWVLQCLIAQWCGLA